MPSGRGNRIDMEPSRCIAGGYDVISSLNGCDTRYTLARMDPKYGKAICLKVCDGEASRLERDIQIPAKLSEPLEVLEYVDNTFLRLASVEALRVGRETGVKNILFVSKSYRGKMHTEMIN